jgi:hypothetical protein
MKCSMRPIMATPRLTPATIIGPRKAFRYEHVSNGGCARSQVAWVNKPDQRNFFSTKPPSGLSASNRRASPPEVLDGGELGIPGD